MSASPSGIGSHQWSCLEAFVRILRRCNPSLYPTITCISPLIHHNHRRVLPSTLLTPQNYYCGLKVREWCLALIQLFHVTSGTSHIQYPASQFHLGGFKKEAVTPKMWSTHVCQFSGLPKGHRYGESGPDVSPF